MLRSFLFSVLIVNAVSAMPEGAPTDPVACRDMTPKHNPHTAQDSPSPYLLHAESDGSEVRVTISAATDDSFTGFFLQARDTDDSLIGTFVTMESLAKIVSCLGAVNNAVTHNTRDNKIITTSYWTPPGGISQNVTFKLTMVRNYEQFWVGQTLYFSPSAQSTTSEWDSTSTPNTPSTTSEWDSTSTSSVPSTTNEWDSTSTPSTPGSANLSSYSNVNIIVLVLITYKLLN